MFLHVWHIEVRLDLQVKTALEWDRQMQIRKYISNWMEECFCFFVCLFASTSRNVGLKWCYFLKLWLLKSLKCDQMSLGKLVQVAALILFHFQTSFAGESTLQSECGVYTFTECLLVELRLLRICYCTLVIFHLARDICLHACVCMHVCCVRMHVCCVCMHVCCVRMLCQLRMIPL